MARMPDPSPELRASLKKTIAEDGVEILCERLKNLDPDYYKRCDLKNPVRVQRALEVIITTGRPYSEVVAQELRPRPFEIEKIMPSVDLTSLRERIDIRVDRMFESGLEEEARSVLQYRHLQPLNTVGYKELFAYFDGQTSIEEARRKIKTNTWHYAKKQLTWLKRYPDIRQIAHDDA